MGASWNELGTVSAMLGQHGLSAVQASRDA
jgi:hypothetical protein